MIQTTFTGETSKVPKYYDGTRWCDRCKKSTKQEIESEGSGNTNLKCTVCGHENFLMQGFNYNLM